MKAHPAEPTSEQCSAGERFEWNGLLHRALWYPQMGGYVGKAVAVLDADEHFDVWVWHDGEFPFTGNDDYRGHLEPVRLHHCYADQFVHFGEQLAELADEQPEPVNPSPEAGNGARRASAQPAAAARRTPRRTHG